MAPHETMVQVFKGGWSHHGTMQWARDRQIDTPCRVRLDIYLVGYGREGGKGEKQRVGHREIERQRERETEGGRGEVGRGRSCVFEREMEKEGTQAGS